MKHIIVIVLSLFLQGCSNSKLERKDFVGIWKAEDNATIELNEDGSVVIKAINISNIFFDKESRIDFIGKWKFTRDMYKKQVIKINSKKYTFDFYISEQGSLFGNKRPRNLYVFIGDPDDMNKYTFVKQIR